MVALAARELVGDGGTPPCVPGGLDEQPADVAVADLRDRPAVWALAGGVLGRDEADERHELRGRLEAREVADLDGDPERGERVDAAQAAQLGDELAPWSLLGRLANRALERLDAPVDEIDGVLIPGGYELGRLGPERWNEGIRELRPEVMFARRLKEAKDAHRAVVDLVAAPAAAIETDGVIRVPHSGIGTPTSAHSH